MNSPLYPIYFDDHSSSSKEAFKSKNQKSSEGLLSFNISQHPKLPNDIMCGYHSSNLSSPVLKKVDSACN